MPVSMNQSDAVPRTATPTAPYARAAEHESTKAHSRSRCTLVPANLDGPFDPPPWLWEGRVPLHELTILAGRGDVGKTTIALDLAAQLSRGELLGELFGRRGKTVFFSDEASFERVITPRYAAASGEPGGLYGIDFVDITDGGAVARHMALTPDDIRALAEAIEEEGIDLLIFDPIDMLLGGIDSHRNNEVRAALRLIMSVGCTVIGIQHVTKNSGVAHAGDRVMGSAAFRNFARSVLFAAHDRSDKELIVLAHDKSNVGPRQPSLSLKTVASDIDGFPRAYWLGEVGSSADDLLVGRRREPLVEQCRTWLRELMETDGPLAADDVLRLAKDEGFGRTTVYEARKLLGVTTDSLGQWTSR